MCITLLWEFSLPQNFVKNISFLWTCFKTNLETTKIYGFFEIKEEMFTINFSLQAALVLNTFFTYSNAHDFDWIYCGVNKAKHVVQEECIFFL